jgi:copper chaperone CopZ
MRRLNVAWVLAFLLVVCVGGVLAAGTASTPSNAAPALETAIFSVPNLMEGTLLRDLAKALSTQEGVQAAQADSEKGTFNVTFEPKKTSPDAIQKTIVSVAKDAKLLSVGPASAKSAHDGCGKCPSAKSCPGAKK